MIYRIVIIIVIELHHPLAFCPHFRAFGLSSWLHKNAPLVSTLAYTPQCKVKGLLIFREADKKGCVLLSCNALYLIQKVSWGSVAKVLPVHFKLCNSIKRGRLLMGEGGWT